MDMKPQCIRSTKINAVPAIADNDSTMQIYCRNDVFMYTLQKMKAMEKNVAINKNYYQVSKLEIVQSRPAWPSPDHRQTREICKLTIHVLKLHKMYIV